VAAALLQGIIGLEVARGTLGEKLTLRQLWSLARGRIGALIGWSFLSAGVALVGVFIVVFAVVLVTMSAGDAAIVVGVLLGIVAAIGLAVVLFWVGTRLSLVPSAIVLERLSLLAAVRRSWNLTIGYFWRTLGIQLLIALMVGIATSIVTTPIVLITTIVSTLSNPLGDPAMTDSTVFVIFVVTTVLSALIGAVTAIISAASTSLIYLDLRIRKEGLDLDLIRFVEGRQTGDTTLPDPYLARSAPTVTTPMPDASESPWA
jgi:hypothetical protein